MTRRLDIVRLAGALCAGLIGGTGGAHAALAIGEGAAAPSQRAVAAAPTGPAGAVSVEWVSGVIEAVDPGRRTLTLRGKPVTLHATRLQVLDGGGPAGGDIAGLRAGMRIRFALEPGHAAERKIVLIAIDRQP